MFTFQEGDKYFDFFNYLRAKKKALVFNEGLKGHESFDCKELFLSSSTCTPPAGECCKHAVGKLRIERHRVLVVGLCTVHH